MKKEKKKQVPLKKKASAGKTVPKKAAKKPAVKHAAAAKPARTAKPARPAHATKSAKPPEHAGHVKAVQAAKPAKPEKSAKASKGGKKRVLCEFCGQPIPVERIDALPETTTCVECSQTKPYSEAQIIGMNGEEPDQNRLNVEDFEEVDTDFSAGYNDQW
jgi:RNA polymerase-binding transcription factor DksA